MRSTSEPDQKTKNKSKQKEVIMEQLIGSHEHSYPLIFQLRPHVSMGITYSTLGIKQVNIVVLPHSMEA